MILYVLDYYAFIFSDTSGTGSIPSHDTKVNSAFHPSEQQMKEEPSERLRPRPAYLLIFSDLLCNGLRHIIGYLE